MTTDAVAMAREEWDRLGEFEAQVEQLLVVTAAAVDRMEARMLAKPWIAGAITAGAPEVRRRALTELLRAAQDEGGGTA